MTYGDYRRIARQYYFEGNINYERIFGEDHRVTGLLNAYRQENKDSYLNNEDDDTTLDERIRSILNVIRLFLLVLLILIRILICLNSM